MRSIRFISIIVVLLSGLSANAQRASVSAAVNKKKILIGEPFTLTVEAKIPSKSRLALEEADTIPHFEKTAPVVFDSVVEGSFTTIRAKYELTSFDSGHWVIPSFVLARGIASDTLGLDVVFSDFDPKQPYHDLQENIEVEVPEEQKKQWWYFVAAGVILLGFILYLLFRKKPPKVVAAAPPVNPYEHAKKQLSELQRSKPASKQYYSALTDIFRVYVLEKKGIHSLQKTTDDLVVRLRILFPNQPPFEKLAQALRLADFVKFAKYVPSVEDDNSSFDAIQNAIDEIEKMPDAV